MAERGSQSNAPDHRLTASDSFRWFLEPGQGRFLLPATGVWILILDWLLFGQNLMTLGLSTLFTSAVGFLLGSAGTFLFQWKLGGDRAPMALFKSVLAGVVVGMPTAVVGTIVGTWILVFSGLANLRKRLPKK